MNRSSGPEVGERHRCIAMRRQFLGPRRGFDVDVVDTSGTASALSASTSWQSARAMSRSQRRAAAGRVQADRHQPGQAGGHQHGREERRIAQQHTDMRRLGRVEPRAQGGGQDRGRPDVVAPADELVLVVDAAVVDLGQRDEQLRRRSCTVKRGCRPARGRCAAAARWPRRPRTRSAWRPGSTGAPGGRGRSRHRRARAPWCGRPGARRRRPRTRRCSTSTSAGRSSDTRHAAWVSVRRRPLTSM